MNKKIPKDKLQYLFELGVQVYNNGVEKNKDKYKKSKIKFDSYLNDLSLNYGNATFILSVAADFCNDADKSIFLLEKAYEIAEKNIDVVNLTSISNSLAATYLYEKKDKENAYKWLSILKTNMEQDCDDFQREEFTEFLKDYNKTFFSK